MTGNKVIHRCKKCKEEIRCSKCGDLVRLYGRTGRTGKQQYECKNRMCGFISVKYACGCESREPKDLTCYKCGEKVLCDICGDRDNLIKYGWDGDKQLYRCRACNRQVSCGCDKKIDLPPLVTRQGLAYCPVCGAERVYCPNCGSWGSMWHYYDSRGSEEKLRLTFLCDTCESRKSPVCNCPTDKATDTSLLSMRDRIRDMVDNEKSQYRWSVTDFRKYKDHYRRMLDEKVIEKLVADMEEKERGGLS